MRARLAQSPETLVRGPPPHPAMLPSPTLPSGRKPPSSFSSMDWPSQSGHVGLSRTSGPAEVSWGISLPASVSSSGEPLQTMGREKGLSKDADPTQAPRFRTAFTVEQVSTLESSFRRRHYLAPWSAGPGDAALRGADKNLVSESPDETQAPSAGLPAEHPLLWSSLHTPGFLPTTLCPGQLPAAPVPLGIPPWAPGFGTASWLLLGSLPTGTSLPGFSMGLVQQPPTCCLPGPGDQVHVLGPALSRGSWGLCAQPETGDVF